MSVPQHIAGYLEDYLDGSLDEAGHRALSDWAHESDANSEALAAWFWNEVQLLEASRLADMQAVFGGLAYASQIGANEPAPRTGARSSRITANNWLLIAASVLVALGIAYVWPGRAPVAGGSSPQVASAGRQAAHASVPPPAMLGRLADCVWGSKTQPLRVGQDIAANTVIDIKSGLAQLVFDSGAEVILKGPCRLRVENSMLCRLFSGSVSAEVPHWAAGFTIRGPSSEVIDLGTRFGFSVGDSGNSEVHVFQGEVISRQLDERGDVIGKDIRLKKNQAILFPGERRQAQRLAANEAKFALEVKPLWLHDQIEPLAVDRKLALWLRAAHGVQTDKKDRVIAWQDLAMGPNRISNDAFQSEPNSRPQYVLDGPNGHPTIRFDGSSTYLTTTPVTTTNDQTIVAVFQYAEPSPSGSRVGGQIVNYNGPPSRFLPDMHSPGVLQLGEKIDVWNGPPFSIAAKAFVGRDSRAADVSAGITTSKSLGYAHPNTVAYVYNNSQNTAVLYVNGQAVAESSAPTSVAVTSRKVIGKHGIFDQWYFRGDLSELVIFNSALRPAEVKSVSHQLMNFYGVTDQSDATASGARPAVGTH
jgi:hypothetical protein